MAVLWSSIFIVIIYFCRKRNNFMQSFGVGSLIVLILGTVFRFLTPIEIPGAYVIPSANIYVELQRFLKMVVISCKDYSVNVLDLFNLTWLTAAVFLIVRLIAQYFRMVKLMSRIPSTERKQIAAALEKVKAEHSFGKNIKVICSTEISVPKIWGFFRPIIFLPNILYTDTELYYIIKHEFTHWLNLDIWIKFTVLMLCCVFWWNPLVYLLKKDLDQALELKCDFKTTSGLDKKSRLNYLAAIVKIAKSDLARPVSKPQREAFAVSEFTGGIAFESRILQRFNMVLSYKPDKKRQAVLTSAIIIIMATLMAFSFLFILQPYVPDSPIGDSESPLYDENGDRIIYYTPESTYLTKNADGTYNIYQNGEFLETIDADFAKGLMESRIPLYKK
jgi:beta-lactamase regulating signal transducer with metallopeptidase domain